MAIGKALVTLGKIIGKSAVKGALPPVNWYEWINDLANQGISGKFSEFRYFTATYKRFIFGKVAPGFIKAGRSAYSMIETMKKVGLGIRKSDAYTIFKAETAKQLAKDKIASLDIMDIPGKDVMIQNPNLMPSNYRYVLELEAFDPDGNYIGNEHVSIYLSEPLSKKDMEKQSQLFLAIMGCSTANKTHRFAGIREIYYNPGLF